MTFGSSAIPDYEVRAQISRSVVQLLKEFAGKGPVKAKTYYVEDVVLVMLGGGFSRVEATLEAAGQGQAVKDQRVAFQAVMRQRFSEAIEGITGRRVISFMSANDQVADLSAELFVLEPRPGTALVETVIDES